MADLNQKHLAIENTEEMVEMADPHSTDSFSKHLEEQMSSVDHNAVANKNESEMVDRTELPFGHGSPHSISSNQRNNQMDELMADMNPKDVQIEEMVDKEDLAVVPDQADDVMVDIKAMLLEREKHPLSTTSPCCIYKVPHITRQLHEDAYTPKVVSIGPLHHGNPRLQNMEVHKQIFFKEFIEEAQTSLDDLINFVESSEPKVRACYSENIDLSEKELVKMILVDAGFIIKLFQRRFDWQSDDAVMSKTWLVNSVVLDLLLLENQLPFFILEEVFNQAFPSHACSGLPRFHELTNFFFWDYNRQRLKSDLIKKHFTDHLIKHFTDLLRIFHLQRRKYERLDLEDGDHALLYSARELQEAGMKFKANKSKCLLDLKFSGDVLEIPQIRVDWRTKTMFLNMIALEQCHYPEESYIADYALLLNCLINTSKDVDILVKEGIICNYLADSSAVATLFNNLDENVIHDNFNSNYYAICSRLNRFYKNPWNNTKATLRRDYCSTPWHIVASIAGIVLLILTLVQTIFSIVKK